MSESASRHDRFPAWLRLLRPLQWSKNLFVFAGLVFGIRFDDATAVINAVVTFVAFCMVSSAMYVFNDWHDRDEDRRHPVKRHRPIASGEVAADWALGLAIGLLGVSLVLASWVTIGVASVVLLYALLMVTYTLRFRQRPFVDVGVIAIGFVLRALAGTMAVSVPISVWLFVCTLLLALLLGICKRRQEVASLDDGLDLRRPTLVTYRHLPLDRIIVALSVLTLAAYAMYTLAANRGEGILLVITLPFVAAALGRYVYLVLAKKELRSPEVLVLKDRPLTICVLGWLLSVAYMVTG